MQSFFSSTNSVIRCSLSSKKAKGETWQKTFLFLSFQFCPGVILNLTLKTVVSYTGVSGGWILFIYLQMLPARPGAQRDGRGVVWETQRCWHWSWGGNPIIASKRHLAVLNQNAGESFLFRERAKILFECEIWRYCEGRRGCGGWRRDQVSPSVTQDSFCHKSSYCTLARELYLLHHWQL